MASLPVTAKKVAIIIASTRAVRIGPAVTSFIKSTIEAASPKSTNTNTLPLTLEFLDLASFKLPVFDEPIIPAMVPQYAQFTQPHSQAWSAAISRFDGYILVSPEYNYGIPGGVKNAIDYLYNEWKGKPIMIVTYGIYGGKDASEGLRKSLEGMHLKVIESRPMLMFPGRDEKAGNMSPDLGSAMGGVLGEGSLAAWKGQEGEIIKGWKELGAILNPEQEELGAWWSG